MKNDQSEIKKITVSIRKDTRDFLDQEFTRMLVETGKKLSVANLIEMICQEVRECREMDKSELDK